MGTFEKTGDDFVSYQDKAGNIVDFDYNWNGVSVFMYNDPVVVFTIEDTKKLIQFLQE